MRVPSMFGAVGPFIAAIAFVAIAAFLVFAIYFTLLELQWIAFLTGTLFASMLAMVSHATRAELAAVDSSAKFAVAQDRLSSETKARQHLESRLEYATRRLRYSDDIFPVMVAYHDAQGIFRYHNHAFRRWVDLPEHHIDGHHLREVLGKVAYARIEPAMARAIAGEAVRYEHTQKMANGAQARLSVQLLPASDGHEYGDGFFCDHFRYHTDRRERLEQLAQRGIGAHIVANVAIALRHLCGRSGDRAAQCARAHALRAGARRIRPLPPNHHSAEPRRRTAPAL